MEMAPQSLNINNILKLYENKYDRLYTTHNTNNNPIFPS